MKKLFNILKLKKIISPLLYTLLTCILLILLYMFFNIFFWLGVQAFIISHEIVINANYALQLSVLKNEKVVFDFYYSSKTNSIQFYWMYGEKTKKIYLSPHLIPSGIRAYSPKGTYTFYFENGNIYPEGEISLSAFFTKRVIKFYKNGKVSF